MKTGTFIVFEGPEGAGKSTQVRLLATELRVAGYSVVETREPGGTPIGERIRALLLDHTSAGMSAETEALLLNAARAQHVRDVIAPALQAGEVVVCDRFSDSTLAYQGWGRGLPLDDLLTLQHFAVKGYEPDIRVLLDLPVELGLARRRADHGSANRLDEELLQFHERVREAFLRLADAASGDWIVVNASAPASDVAREISQAMRARIPFRQTPDDHAVSGNIRASVGL